MEAYPLHWPVDWPRTPAHERQAHHRYQVTFARARDDLVNSLHLLGARSRDIVISSNVPVRQRDGLPLANFCEPPDPGIAVYWNEQRITGDGLVTTPRVMACDCWARVRDNLRAVGLSVDAMRQLKRAGASQILNRAFRGFTALPEYGRRHWRHVLSTPEYPGELRTKDDARHVYRLLAARSHPDKGGSNAQMAELNAAYQQALQELA